MERPPLSSSSSKHLIANVLADAFTTGPWLLDELVARGALVLGRRWRWLRPLAGRVLLEFGTASRPPTARVATFLGNDPRLWDHHQKHAISISAGPWALPVLWPAPGTPVTWILPQVTTTAALADHLAIEPNELDWFADCHTQLRNIFQGPLGHYRYRWQPKAAGSARLVEMPKLRLKTIQRTLLKEFLDKIPPHDAAHGYRHGRSVKSFAAPHVGRRVVLKMDLRDFFPTIGTGRIRAIFRTAGYPEPIARSLTGLCTNSVPSALWSDPSCPIRGAELTRAKRIYREPHLPQGAPTSPALANLSAYRLDVRLSKLAESVGGCYTRYADDLVISGDRELERSVNRFHVHVCAIALEEGFEINTRKTRIMRQGVRQRIAGVVVNARTNVTRDEFDTLKAILHNCVRHGPEVQNREGQGDFRAHLAGRVAHVGSLNPERGERLRALMGQITW